MFVEYSPGSGVALIAQHGPPMRVLLDGVVTPGQTVVFDAAADRRQTSGDRVEAAAVAQADSISEVDRVIQEVWGSAGR